MWTLVVPPCCSTLHLDLVGATVLDAVLLCAVCHSPLAVVELVVDALLECRRFCEACLWVLGSLVRCWLTKGMMRGYP